MMQSAKSVPDLTYIDTLDELEAICRVMNNAERYKQKHPPGDPLHEWGCRAWDMAFDRMCQVYANRFDPQSELERDCLVAVAAYEWVLTDKNGQNTAATRVRGSINRNGIKVAIANSVLRGKRTIGLKTLIEMNKIGFSFEYVVKKYHDEFPRKVVEAAEKALKNLKFS